MNPHLRLLLLLAAAALCQGAPLAGELRCRCVRTVSEVIPPRRLARLEFLAEGPHCAVPEVIATMKQGQMICLDPVAPWVKLLGTRILRRKIRLATPKMCPESGFCAGEQTTQQVVRESIHDKCLINCKSSHIQPTSCECGKEHLGMKLPVCHKIPGNRCCEDTIAQLSSFGGFVDQMFYVSFPLLIVVIA